MTYRKGERVVHPTMSDWGLGEVLEDSEADSVTVFFVGAGERTLSLKHVTPERVSGAASRHPLLDNLLIKADASGIRYQSLPESIQVFLTRFPGGFQGERFQVQERIYKEKAHQLATELLGVAPLNELLSGGHHAEVVRRALKLVNATNLMYPGEKISLRDGLKDEGSHAPFARSLHGLLHGEHPIEDRFMAFSRCLENIGAAKWTTATYFPFFVHPDDYMFVKPTVTMHAAQLSRFELNYSPQLNWRSYHSVLGFSRFLWDQLAALKPKDMIDIQSFMWCVAPKTSRGD